MGTPIIWSLICMLLLVSWPHTIVCMCVYDLTSGGLQTQKGGNVIDHCLGNKWTCVLEQFWCECAWIKYQCRCTLFIAMYVHLTVHLCTALCVHLRMYACLCVCTKRSCRSPDVRICLMVTPTINQKALTNEQIEATESESNTQTQKQMCVEVEKRKETQTKK